MPAVDFSAHTCLSATDSVEWWFNADVYVDGTKNIEVTDCGFGLDCTDASDNVVMNVAGDVIRGATTDSNDATNMRAAVVGKLLPAYSGNRRFKVCLPGNFFNGVADEYCTELLTCADGDSFYDWNYRFTVAATEASSTAEALTYDLTLSSDIIEANTDHKYQICFCDSNADTVGQTFEIADFNFPQIIFSRQNIIFFLHISSFNILILY